MILSLFRRRRQPGTISALYGMIVAQARMPIFYRAYGVPDTVNGRFDMIVLHLALVLRRLGLGRTAPSEVGQQLFDHFCRDMDANLREIGIADLKVPKEMRRIGEAFYGRARAYDAALTEPGNETLSAAISRNVYGGDAAGAAAPALLAAYMREVAASLDGQDTSAIESGRLRFPDAPIAAGTESH